MLSKGLRKHTTLTNFKCFDCGIGDAGVRMFAKQVKRLDTLGLQNNEITDG